MTFPLEWSVEILIFLIVATVTFAISQELQRVVQQRRRLGEQSLAREQTVSPLLQKRGSANPFFQWVQKSTSISDSAERDKLGRELYAAGFDSPSAPVWFIITRFVLAIGLPLLFLLSRSLFALKISSAGMIFWSMVLCAAGLLLPRSLLDRRIRARRQQLEFEFPDALDLMVVCVEAGLSLEAAFVRVGQEVSHSHPRIGREFARVSDELRAGRGRADTLRDLGNRTDVDGVKSFAALVIQTEALGTSIAQTLRTYSAEMRETRYLKAEERAMRIPVMMTVPLVACILPVIVAAVLLPAIIDIIRVLLPSLTSVGAHHGGHP
jgi:tight adherence protein C